MTDYRGTEAYRRGVARAERARRFAIVNIKNILDDPAHQDLREPDRVKAVSALNQLRTIDRADHQARLSRLLAASPLRPVHREPDTPERSSESPGDYKEITGDDA